MQKKKCCQCEVKIPPDEVQVHDGETYCEDCFHEDYQLCYRCDDYHYRYDMLYCDENDGMYCEDCYEERSLACDRCDWDQIASELNSTSDDRYNRICDDCEEYLDRQNARVIKPYSFKPMPLFFMGKNEKPYQENDPKERRLVFGFELEVENLEGGYDNEEIIKGHLKDIFPPDFLYFKEDSSIDEGFEIVSHPMSRQFFKENKKKFELLLNICKEFGLRSYQSGRCGLHISVTRKAFTKLSFLKFVSFWNNGENKRMFKALSQRRDNQINDWCRIDATYNKGTMIDLSKMKESNRANFRHDIARYRALNLQNRHTLEIRLFRGTLFAPSFFKGFELVLSSFDWSNEADLKLHKITKPTISETDETLLKRIKEARGTEIAQITPSMINRNWFQVFVHQNKKRYPDLYRSLDHRLPMFHLNGTEANLKALNKQMRKGNK